MDGNERALAAIISSQARAGLRAGSGLAALAEQKAAGSFQPRPGGALRASLARPGPMRVDAGHRPDSEASRWAAPSPSVASGQV